VNIISFFSPAEKREKRRKKKVQKKKKKEERVSTLPNFTHDYLRITHKKKKGKGKGESYKKKRVHTLQTSLHFLLSKSKKRGILFLGKVKDAAARHLPLFPNSPYPDRTAPEKRERERTERVEKGQEQGPFFSLHLPFSAHRTYGKRKKEKKGEGHRGGKEKTDAKPAYPFFPIPVLFLQAGEQRKKKRKRKEGGGIFTPSFS